MCEIGWTAVGLHGNGRPRRRRAPRGQNKAAILDVVTQRSGITATEIAERG
jgi:hypothetical protein